MAAIGISCFVFSFVPSVTYAFLSGNMDVFLSGGIWALVAGAIATGVLVSLNLFGSGPNATGTAIIYVLSLGTGFYVGSIIVSFGKLGIPFEGVLDAFTTILFALGVWLISAIGGKEA